MKFKRPAEEEEGLQIAPIVDVFFLLLIFFMTASIYAQYERKVNLIVPKAATGENLPRYPGEIIINIDRKGDCYVNNQIRSLQQLDLLLRDIAAHYTGQPVILRCDRAAEHRHFVAVYDLCRLHAIENVRIATVSQDQP